MIKKLTRPNCSGKFLHSHMGSFFIVTWGRGVVVITTSQFHSTTPELKFCAGPNPGRGVSEIGNGEDL